MIYYDCSDLIRVNANSGIQRVVTRVGKLLQNKYGSQFQAVAFIGNSFFKVNFDSLLAEPVRSSARVTYDSTVAKIKKQIRSLPLGLSDLIVEAYSQLPFFLKPQKLKLFLRAKKEFEAVKFGKDHKLIIFDAVWNLRSSYISSLEKLKASGVELTVCIYDLMPISHEQFFDKSVSSIYKAYLKKIVNLGDKFICISKFTADCLEEYIEKNRTSSASYQVEEFKLGADFSVSALPSSGAEFDYSFILNVSTIEPRKNQEFLIDCFLSASVSDSLKLVIVGRDGWKNARVLEKLQNNPRVIWLNQVSDAELSRLYEKCKLFVFPSVIEGFGVPIIEALSKGKFVLASNQGPMPEAGGEFADYFSPFEKYELVTLLEKYLNHDDVLRAREKKIHDEFKLVSWADSASQVSKFVEAEL